MLNNLQLQYIGVPAEQGRRMGDVSFTPPSSACIAVCYSRLKIGIGVAATLHINVFGALLRLYGFVNTAN